MTDHRRNNISVRTWNKTDGEPISCLEKIKVLNQNYEELRQIAQDALDDALLMGCSEEQIRLVFHQIVDELHNSYASHELQGHLRPV